MSSYKLFICEKPSQAADYASAFEFSKIKDYMKNDASYTRFKREGHIVDEQKKMIVVWAQGHLVRLFNPKEYGDEIKPTRTLDDFPMLPKFQYKVDDDPMVIEGKSYPSSKLKIFNIMKKVFQDYNIEETIISSDAGREGDTIGWLIMEKIKYSGKISRILISDLSKATILKGYENRRVEPSISRAAIAGKIRIESDWFLGMNLSRAFTLHNRDMLGSERLPMGRVLTALVNIVVMRENEIVNFKPLSYYDMSAVFGKSASESIKMNWQPKKEYLDEVEGKCLEKSLVDNLKSKLTDGVVTKSEKVRKDTNHPRSFNLAGLSAAAFKEFGYDAPQVLEIAQLLYEDKKVISYPRTDCIFLAPALLKDAAATFNAVSRLTGDDNLKSVIGKADPNFQSTTWSAKEVEKTEHHAIMPIPNADTSSLSGDQRNLYDIISRNYIAQFLPKYEYDQTVLEVESSGETFRASCSVPMVAGWKEAIKEVSDKEDNVPVLDVGAAVSLISSEVNSKKTTPPSRFNAGTIITEMNNASKYVVDKELKKIISDVDGIGTQATQAGIYKNCIDYKYILLDKKKVITPSKKALLLIENCPEEIKSVEKSAVFEKLLKSIERGEYDPADFFKIQVDTVKKAIDGMKDGKYKIKEPVGQKCDHCKKASITRIQSKKNKKFYWICQSKECGALFEDNKNKVGKLLNKAKPVDQGSVVHNCDDCKSSVLVRREGQYGFYWNCGECRKNYKDVDMKPVATVKKTVIKDYKCPDCKDGYLQPRNGSSPFWGCSAFPKCKKTKKDIEGKPEGF